MNSLVIIYIIIAPFYFWQKCDIIWLPIKKGQKMKNRFKPALFVGLALLFSNVATCVAVAANLDHVSNITTHRDGLPLPDTSDIQIEGLFYDDLLSVPYISLEDYFGAMGDTAIVEGPSADGDYAFSTASNPDNKMIVNPENDTIYFANYTAFVRGGQDQSAQQQIPYLTNPRIETIGTPNPVTLNLGNYNIDLRVNDGKVYFPLSTLSDLFSITAYVGASYSNDEIALMILMDDAILLAFGDSPVYDSRTRSQDLIDYSYNELQFVMDYLYGKPAQGYLAETIKNKGFDRALLETNTDTQLIRTLLHSADMVEYIQGLYMLDAYLYDGGHTMLSAVYMQMSEGKPYRDDVLTMIQNQETLIGYTTATKTLESQAVGQAVNQARVDGLSEFEVAVWPEAEAGYYEKGDTGIFVFDRFKDEVVPHFKEAIDLALAGGMKNFVIDLAANGGGSSGVLHYIFSIIADEYDGIENMTMLDNNRVRTTFTVDKNLDGNFDELDDTFGDGLNFAILTSKLSFSCGNLLPSVAKDSGIVILGEQSGGGTCASSRGFYPNGPPYVVSGFDCFVNSNGEQIDGGVRPNYLLATYDGFYNFDLLSQKIHEFYGDQEFIPLAPNSGVGPSL